MVNITTTTTTNVRMILDAADGDDESDLLLLEPDVLEMVWINFHPAKKTLTATTKTMMENVTLIATAKSCMDSRTSTGTHVLVVCLVSKQNRSKISKQNKIKQSKSKPNTTIQI